MNPTMMEQLKALGDDFVAGTWAYDKIERLQAALTKLSDPLLIEVDGTGFKRAMKMIEAMRKIATDALDDELERAAADLWRQENPGKSVFACDVAEKDRYRQRIRATRGHG